MIKAVIFDLDGTLLDTLSTIAHFGNLALKSCGLDEINEEKYKYFAGDGKKILLKRMLEFHNAYSDELFQKLERKYDKGYEADAGFNTKPFEGICELLAKLKVKKIKLAVCSNKPDNVVNPLVDSIFGGLFDLCYGKKENLPLKPNPQCVFEIMDILDLRSDECLFVGDTDVDIKTAKNAGNISVGVLWGFRDYNELDSAGADYIIEKPCEIYDIVLKIENEITREK